MTEDDTTPHIGTLSERSLHAALKAYLTQPGDLLEAACEGYVIDIMRGEELIEIQTVNFNAMKKKLRTLTRTHKVHLYHPVPVARWIQKLAPDGETLLERRKSPKRGGVYDLFRELVSFPDLMHHPNFSVSVILVHEEELRCKDGKGSWRRKGWSIIDRQLLEVVETHTFHTPADLLGLLPDDLPDPFTNRQLSNALEIRMRLAQQMTYCLRGMDVLEVIGKKGRAYLHAPVLD